MTANVGGFRPIRQELWIFSSTRESHQVSARARNRLLGRRDACVDVACLKDGAMKKIAATVLVVMVSSVLAGARPGSFTPYTLDRKQSKLEIHVFREGFLKPLATTTSFLRQSCPDR